jgi:hypothetical protein
MEKTKLISSRYQTGLKPYCVKGAKSFNGKYYLSPHFPDIFKNHVAVTIEGSDTTQQLFVIPTINEHLLGENNSIKHLLNMRATGKNVRIEGYLGVVFNTHHENRKWSGVKFLFLIFNSNLQNRL